MSKETNGKENAAFTFIEILIMISVLGRDSLLLVANYLGITWWTKVETSEPTIIYWFGPFIFKRVLVARLITLINY